MMQTGAVNVGGLMNASADRGFQSVVATAMRSRIGVGSSKFHTGGEAGPADTVYLGTFKKSAILQAGGFDEKYIRAQDWELNHRLRLNGGFIWFDPRLVVTYRPRDTFRKLAKQYFEYGRWRRAVSREHKGTVNYRYLAPPIALVINFFSIILGLFFSSIFFLPVLIYLLTIIFSSLFIGKSIYEKLTLPMVLITMHVSWGFGFITSPKNLIN